MPEPLLPVIDGHNDMLLRLFREPGDPVKSFLDGSAGGHLDLPRMKAAGFAGGFFAIFVPSSEDLGPPDAAMMAESYDLPLPAQLAQLPSLQTVLGMAALLLRIERASQGRLRICRTGGEMRQAVADGVIAAVLHIEGAEAIDADFAALDVLHAAGLRSVGPVWSRPTAFGHGVPFRFPSGPDTGDGLTDLGKELVRRCNALNIMLDLSHLNEKGFWDVADLTDAPLVATHSNAHAVTTHSRNLTDRQLKAVGETGGIVGLNFATSFLRPDGRQDVRTPFSDMLRHLDHLIEMAGVDHVGIGSDFDGATVPDVIGDVKGLPALVDAMRAHGYDEATLRKLTSQNWLRVIDKTLGA